MPRLGSRAPRPRVAERLREAGWPPEPDLSGADPGSDRAAERQICGQGVTTYVPGKDA